MELSRYLHLGAPAPLRVAVRTADRFVTHEMMTYAAALAYRSLLALFPFAIFVIAVVNSLDVWRLFDMLLDWARTAPQGRVPNAIKEWAVVQSRERAQGRRPVGRGARGSLGGGFRGQSLAAGL